MLASLLLAVAPSAAPQDIVALQVANQVDHFGADGSLLAYAASTTACNPSAQEAPWSPALGTAPVIGQNLFALVDLRMVQLGYSFLAQASCAVNEQGCGACQPTGCASLGAGCASTRSVAVNDGAFGISKAAVDPSTGQVAANPPGPSGPSPQAGRLLVDAAELQAAGPFLYYEVQYVYPVDHPQGGAANNLAWRRVMPQGSGGQLSPADTARPGQAALLAWAEVDTAVQIEVAVNPDEGGPGADGVYLVAHAVRDLGGGQHRYDYAVQNLSSRVAARALEVTTCGPATLSQPYFHDVEPHSGDPWDGTDWSFSTSPAGALWRGPTHAANPLGNALRWGTLYTFSLVANAAPLDGSVRLHLFEGGGFLDVPARVPGSGFEEVCDSNPNSTGQAAPLLLEGSSSVADQDLRLSVFQLPANSPGYFLMSRGTQLVPLFSGSQGNLCVGGQRFPIVRFASQVLTSGPFGFVGAFQPHFGALPQGVVFGAGERWAFQYWYRDQNPGPTSNTSSARSVLFCP